MKNALVLTLLFMVFGSCKNPANTDMITADKVQSDPSEFISFGAEIDPQNAMDAAAMMQLYRELKEGDTIAAKFKAPVNSVCKMKGCWMRLAMEDQEAFVKFKDYGFFVPKTLSEVEVVVSGVAYVSKTSVEDLKHFAQDAGQSQEEIDAITESELSLDFMADGVLVPAAAVADETTQDAEEDSENQVSEE